MRFAPPSTGFAHKRLIVHFMQPTLLSVTGRELGIRGNCGPRRSARRAVGSSPHPRVRSPARTVLATARPGAVVRR
jgi:hypothetical protein